MRGARKRTRSDSGLLPEDSVRLDTPQRRGFAIHEGAPRPRTPGGSISREKPLQRPPSRSQSQESSDEYDPATGNNLTALLQTRETFNGHDAISLLCDAAIHTDMNHNRARRASIPAEGQDRAVQTRAQASLHHTQHSGRTFYGPASNTDGNRRPVPHSGRKDYADNTSIYKIASKSDLNTGVKAWCRSKFVRARRFTAHEAIRYVDYFYRYLSPLTPVTVPNYHNPSLHGRLLAEEPMLAVTILTIASRYLRLNGPTALSRGYAIHQMLWLNLRGMIDEVIWGQERFGGHSASQAFDATAGRGKGCRTLGTVESLLLLTEWHPRVLHFPTGPSSEEWLAADGVLAFPDDNDVITDEVLAQEDAIAHDPIAGNSITSWLEAVWRSDRMCWFLIANAQALAYELGVFDKVADTSSHLQLDVDYPTFHRRSENVRRLLFVYSNQTSGRLTLPSMLPDSHCRDLFVEDPIKKADALVKSEAPLDAAQLYKKPEHVEVVQDVVVYFWSGIAGQMKRGNRELFATRETTREVVSSGRYAELIDDLTKGHQAWKREFDHCKTSTPTLSPRYSVPRSSIHLRNLANQNSP